MLAILISCSWYSLLDVTNEKKNSHLKLTDFKYGFEKHQKVNKQVKFTEKKLKNCKYVQKG